MTLQLFIVLYDMVSEDYIWRKVT